MQLVFATSNQNKLIEIQALLPNTIELLSLNDIGFSDEIEETEKTLEGNASLKAKTIYSKTQYNCFADDTGLEVEALNGKPGVFSARYAGEERDASKNMSLLLENLAEFPNKNAQFRTVISLIINGDVFQFEGITKGSIIDKPKGLNGFGYDPIFIPHGQDKSFAELSMEEKNKWSHRAKAFNKMIEFLKSY
jgi:XTP/dITP diphosphohydrolase